MRKKIEFLALVLLLVVLITPGYSGMKKLAQTGLQFLKIDASARSAAMGSAYMIVGDDASAMFANPAGIAMMSNSVDFFVNRTEWIADISYNAFGLVKNMGVLGNFGVSIQIADYGDIIGTRVTATEQGFERTGNLDVGAYAVGLSYGRSLTDKFTIGGQVKYCHQNLGENLLATGNMVENSVSGLAYDFGTIFYPGFKSLRFGMSIRNFSQQFKYEEYAFELPLTFTIGFAMDVLDFMGEHQNPLIIALDAVHPRDYSERLHLGGEYLLLDMFAFRAGYKLNYDEEGLTAGIGFKYPLSGLNLKLDYAYSDFGALDAINRFSVGLSF